MKGGEKMPKTKKMDESAFARLVKEFDAVGELIRARQDEKQAVIDEFNSESKRFFFGKISEKTLSSSARKTNQELQKLDSEIRTAIAGVTDLGLQARKFASAQSPKSFRATLSGISGGGLKKRKRPPVRKKAVKKKVVKRKVVKKKVAKRKPSRKKETVKRRKK